MNTASIIRGKRGAAPTAYGGSPEVFLAKRSKPLLTNISEDSHAVQAEVPMTAPREGALFLTTDIRRPTSPSFGPQYLGGHAVRGQRPLYSA